MILIPEETRGAHRLSSNWDPHQQLLLHTRCRDLGVRSTGKQQEEEGAGFNREIFAAGLHSGLPKSPSAILLLL